MKQALHILRKDLRHQRIDLVLYLGFVALLGFLIPIEWDGHQSSNVMMPWLVGLVKMALPVTWLVIIARLVHAEALSGDRQFWTTRPYRWTSLLTAKLLFLLLCIALPYLAMQCALVLYGGLSPLNGGLLVDAGMHLLIVWIPMFLLAAVTATLVAAFFTTLATAIVWLATLAILIGSQGPLADAPFTRPLLAVIFAAIYFALLISLYKQRNVLQTRILVGSAALIFILLIVFVSKVSPASLGTLLLNLRYHPNSSRYRLVYDPSTPHTAKGQGSSGLRYVSLPIQLEGLPSGNRLHGTVVQFHLDAVGYKYASPWRPASLGLSGLRLMVPETVLEHAGRADTHLTVQLAADEITPGETRTTEIQGHFTIPGGGSCTASDPTYKSRSASTAIVCRFAYAVPQPVEIQAHMQPGCAVATPPPIRVPVYEGGPSMDPLTHWPIGPRGGAGPCSVQSLTTTVYRTVNRFRTSVDIPSIRIADDLDQ